MEKTMEVNERDVIIGLRPRKDFYSGKYIHRGAHLILKNSKNQILLQKRSPHKIWNPNMFNYAAGGTVSDESYKECIVRETEEELGIKVKVKELFKIKYFSPHDKGFHKIFLAVSDDNLSYEKKEISSVKWVDEAFLKKDIVKNKADYTPVFIIGIKKFFKLQK
ncbi:NUDIX domain-containing protein [Candidatus Woesearchaeota archaeon]|nr:MAG: NUDIX domain-containing protein [Candidatus Woesearchaeota archaeon]